jgi:hypothetical protein
MATVVEAGTCEGVPDDPYMRDPNIRKAANLQFVAWPALGAGLGAGCSGWFDFSPAIGIPVGIVLGYLIAAVILRMYGGRSTR